MKECNCSETSCEAFTKAIKEGRLSKDQNHKNYAGNYMYMGVSGGKDLFKHINTREYID